MAGREQTSPLRRLAWFIGIWALSVVALGMVSSLIRLLAVW